MNYPENLLNCGGNTLELESNCVKKRVGILIRTDIEYVRRTDLEVNDIHLLIIDVKLDVVVRIINV